MDAHRQNGSPLSLHKLELEWQTLADKYLPIRGDDNSNWRYSRRQGLQDPEQGWKLHVSATILNALDIFRACAPYLRKQGLLFKACSTLDLLRKLNSGIIFGFSQIGKFITVYPPTAKEALRVAADLHELTVGFGAPKVPYDLPYHPGSCVHYRYGGFRTIEVVEADGRRNTAIRDPSGKLWTDRREPGHAVPEWITNPFPTYVDEIDPASPLCTQFLTYNALSQRGKGGVYQAIDMRQLPPRKCILKEGRHHGETAIDGSDGREWVHHEEVVLVDLYQRGVPVAEFYANFEIEEHRYLAMEFIEGDNLMGMCSTPRRKLSLATCDSLAARIANLVAEIHDAGWVWRDCKPFNLIITPEGFVRPIDFEGAVPVDSPTNIIWGTPGYTPPELEQGPTTGSNLPEDLFALGATLYQLYTSQVPITTEAGKEPRVVQRPPIGRLRKGIHPATRELILALLDPDPRARPTAHKAAQELNQRMPTTPVTVQKVNRRRRTDKGAAFGMATPFIENIPGGQRIVLHNPDTPGAVPV